MNLKDYNEWKDTGFLYIRLIIFILRTQSSYLQNDALVMKHNSSYLYCYIFFVVLMSSIILAVLSCSVAWNFTVTVVLLP